MNSPRRFVEIRDGCGYLVIDCKDPNRPVIVCKCEGFNAPLNAEYVSAALQSYHDNLMTKVLIRDAVFPDLDAGDIEESGSEGC